MDPSNATSARLHDPRHGAPSRRHAAGWWFGAAAVVAIASLTLAWRSARSTVPQIDVATVAVVRGELEDAVPALGSLQPSEFIDVGTQVSGQLKRVLVGIGERVRAGTLLAEIDGTVSAARVEAGGATLQNLAAQIEERQAQHALAAQQYERNAALFKEQAISRDAVDNAQAAMRVTAAQIAALNALRQQTQASLKIEQANLGYTRIYAPIDGTVVSLGVRQGQTINASQQAPVILRIANLDAMTVVAQVSEADVVRLTPGMEAYFHTLGWPDRRWSARVRQILPTPETVNNVVLYSVLFDVANADQQLKPLMSAQVFFVLGRARNALLAPVAALKKGGSAARADSIAGAGADAPAAAASAQRPPRSYRVRVLKDGRLEDREVQVGLMNRTLAQVVSGLHEGEQVVVGPAAAARDGKARAGARRPGRSS